MRSVDSGALDLLNPGLGLAGGGSAAQQTILEDGTLIQTVAVNEVASRARSILAPPGAAQGWALCRLTKTGAGVYQYDVDPYAPDSVSFSRAQGYPATVPEGYDFYLYTISCDYASGTQADLDRVEIGIVSSGGWTFSNVQKTTRPVLVTFDGYAGTTALDPLRNSLTLQTAWEGCLRIRRGDKFFVRQVNSGGVAPLINDVSIRFGLVPMGLSAQPGV